MLDKSKRKEVDKSRSIDVTPAFIYEDSSYLKKSHKTLLMLRRLSKDEPGKIKLELRHQRTGDVVFDFKNMENETEKPQDYIYSLIETLLPKAVIDYQKKQFKMLEIWATDDVPREGWVKFYAMLDWETERCEVVEMR